MNIKRVLFLPISVAWYLALFLPIELVSFLVKMTLCAPCAAYSGKRSMQVGKTSLSLRDRHTYQWGHHPWGEGPIEHAYVPAQTFRVGIPEGSVPGQAINVKVPVGFGQSGQTRTIVVPPLGQAYVDVPLNAAVVLHGVAPPAGRQGKMFQVLVPDGMRGGQKILVEIPSGRMEVEIPQGLEAGQAFRFLVGDPAAAQQAPAALINTAPPQGQMFEALVPDGMRGGQKMLVETPSGMMEVGIPQGLEGGQAFQYRIAAPAAPQQAPAALINTAPPQGDTLQH